MAFEEKWDRTRDILISAVGYFAEFEPESSRRNKRNLSWTDNGVERIQTMEDVKAGHDTSKNGF